MQQLVQFVGGYFVCVYQLHKSDAMLNYIWILVDGCSEIRILYKYNCVRNTSTSLCDLRLSLWCF
jgi:hypothetical protein